MGFLDFFTKKHKKELPTETRSDFSMEIKYDNSVTPNVTVKTQDESYGYNLKTKYVEISTAGDERVCPMCAQFEGKIFAATDAPKLPLCPSCSCAYLYYFSKEDLPSGSIISKKENFTFPAECVSSFYKHQQSVYDETDIEKKIRICKGDLKKLPELMAPYLSAGFPAPSDLACRDLLPDLYMQLGKWESSEQTIQSCIEAKAYYPEDGSKAMTDFERYKKVATETLAYISNKPGCLQSSIYKAMKYEDDEKECLKDFLRNSKLIRKEKHNNTNKLYCTEENIKQS